MKVQVQCQFTIEVDAPDDPEYDARFDIEDNHCPGTGVVWTALSRHMDECEAAHICWACALGGKNKIVG
jgi:hypothetical protein